MNCHGRKAAFLWRVGSIRFWRCIVLEHPPVSKRDGMARYCPPSKATEERSGTGGEHAEEREGQEDRGDQD